MRNRLWIVLGVVLGLVGVALVHLYIQQREVQLRRELMKGREPTPVLIALQDIEQDATMTGEMVEVQMRPADAIQPRALDRKEDAEGKIALVPIYKDEQVVDSKLERAQTVDTLAQKTPPGKRAVTMNVDEVTGVGGFVHPGDFVDILGVFNIPGANQQLVPITVTLLQRVSVLAVGQVLSEIRTTKGRQESPATTVTLALTPQETELVLFSREQGKLQLALRSRADTQTVQDLPPMTLDSLITVLLGPQALAQQPVSKAAERKVEVYRGLKKEVVILSEASP